MIAQKFKDFLKTECLAGFTLGVSALFALLHLYIGLTNDTNTLLHYSLYLLRDGGMYERWMEVNPPLIMLLYAPAAFVIGWFNATPNLALHGYTLLLCLGSLYVTLRALRAHKLSEENQTIWFAASAFILFVLSAIHAVYADREHLLFVFALPWIIQMLLGLAPTRLSSVLAGIGFCIKPYNLIIFIVMQLVAGPKNPSLLARVSAPSVWIVGGVCITYLAVIYLFFPGYLFRVLPLAHVTYGFIVQLTTEERLVKASSYIGPLFFLAGIYFDSRQRWVWVAACLAFSSVYMANAGWPYTEYLLIAPYGLTCFRLWQQSPGCFDNTLPNITTTAVKRTAAWIAALGLLAVSIFEIGKDISSTHQRGYSTNYTFSESLITALHKEAGDHFVFFSTTLWATNVVPFNGAPQHALAYDCLWPLPWLYAHPNDEKATEVKKVFNAEILRAVNTKPFPILIVDESPLQRMLPLYSNSKTFFESDKSLKSAFSSYKHVSTINTCNLYDIVLCKYTIWKHVLVK